VAAFARREAPGSTQNTKITTDVAVAERVAEFRYGKDRKSDAKA
jgi:hypothetical protein